MCYIYHARGKPDRFAVENIAGIDYICSPEEGQFTCQQSKLLQLKLNLFVYLHISFGTDPFTDSSMALPLVRKVTGTCTLFERGWKSGMKYCW